MGIILNPAWRCCTENEIGSSAIPSLLWLSGDSDPDPSGPAPRLLSPSSSAPEASSRFGCRSASMNGAQFCSCGCLGTSPSMCFVKPGNRTDARENGDLSLPVRLRFGINVPPGQLEINQVQHGTLQWCKLGLLLFPSVCVFFIRSGWMKLKNWYILKVRKTLPWSITCMSLTTRLPER